MNTSAHRNPPNTWQKDKSQEAQKYIKPVSDVYSLPPALSVSQIIPWIPSPVTSVAAPVSNLQQQATTSTTTMDFLGPLGIQLRDQERWGYQKP